MELNCEMLGLTKEQMMDRVIDSMAEKLLNEELTTEDEDGRPQRIEVFYDKLAKLTQTTVDERLNELKKENILPKLAELIDGVLLQRTNEWGEEKGEPMTFIEFLVQHAETYMLEEVDSYGKTKKESDRSYWSAKTTRLMHLVDKNMSDQFQKVANELNKHARDVLAEALGEAMKGQLAKAASEVKVKLVR